MRLIDEILALKKIEQIPYVANGNKAFHEGCRYMQKKALRVMHEAPTVDAEPVIRCKKCEHYNTSCFQDGCGWCEMLGCSRSDECYCSDAEPKARDEE